MNLYYKAYIVKQPNRIYCAAMRNKIKENRGRMKKKAFAIVFS